MGGKTMLSNKQLMTLGVIVVVLAGGVWLGQQFGLLSVAPAAGSGAAAAQIRTGGTCPSTGLTNMQYQAQYLDISTNTETAVNTTVDVYKGIGSSVAAASLFSGTTGTSGYTTISTSNCGSDLTSYIGDGGTTYYYAKVETPAASTGGANTQVLAELKKSSAITVTFQNSSATGWTSTTAQGGVGSGATSSDVTMRIKAGQYYYGDGAFEVCAQFATSNITKVSFGAEATETAVDKSLATAANTDTRCYEVKANLNNYVTKDLPVVIQAAAGVTPSNTSIRIYVNDATARLKNGQFVDRYFNSDTTANLGLAATNTAAAIVVN